MVFLARLAKALGVVAGVLAIFLSISTFSSRYSLYLWFLLAVFFLPLAFWFRSGFVKCCVAFSVVAVSLAISPIDFTIQHSGKEAFSYCQSAMALHVNLALPATGASFLQILPRKALVLSY